MLFKRLRNLFQPPAFDDEEKTRVARLLHTILLSIAFGVFMIFVTTLLFAPERTNRLLITAAFLFLAGGNLFLARRGMVSQASVLFITTLWLVLMASALTGGGSRGIGFASHIVVLVLAGLLLGPKFAYLMASLSFIGAVAIAIAEVNGIVFPAPPTNYLLNLLTFSFYLLLTALLLQLASNSITRSLKRARQDEAELAARNGELQTEIAERQRTEEILRRNESQLRLAVDAAQMRAWEWDIKTGSILATGKHVASAPSEAEVFSDFMNRIHPDDQAIVQAAISHAYATRQAYTAEYRVMLEDGGYNWVESVGQILYDDDGTPRMMRGISLNITERKETEQQHLELALQKERITALSEFMSNMSHDLRTPLTIINTSTYMLEQMINDERPRQKIQQIKEQADLLEKYVEDILTMSRLDFAGELPLETEDFNRLVGEVESLLRSSGEHKKLDTHLELASDTLPIMANPDDMTRAVSNLIENAVRYTPENGSVIVRTRSDDHFAILEVADTGIGISENELSRIFTRFYRAEKAKKTHANGTGLGLAIVKKIIERHRGAIEVESQPGRGSVFRVYLPFVSKA